MLVQTPVRPLAEHRPNEPLRLAVRLRVIQPRENLPRAEYVARSAESERAKNLAVVGHNARETDSADCEIGRRRFEDFGRIFTAFSFANLYERRPTGVVDTDVGVLPTGARRSRSSITVYPMSGAYDSAELFYVDVCEGNRPALRSHNERPEAAAVRATRVAVNPGPAILCRRSNAEARRRRRSAMPRGVRDEGVRSPPQRELVGDARRNCDPASRRILGRRNGMPTSRRFGG